MSADRDSNRPANDRRSRSGGGSRPGGRGRGGGGGGGGAQSRGGGGRSGRAGGGQPSPLEQSARSTRNALRRHGESLRDEQSSLACRSVLVAIVGATRGVSSPAELLGVVEQVVHVLEAGRREEAQLPVAVRAVVSFSLEQPRRQRDVGEMLRLVLRHGYALAADHIPRQLRDDGPFRASALQDALTEVSALYLSDERFAAISRR